MKHNFINSFWKLQVLWIANCLVKSFRLVPDIRIWFCFCNPFNIFLNFVINSLTEYKILQKTITYLISKVPKRRKDWWVKIIPSQRVLLLGGGLGPHWAQRRGNLYANDCAGWYTPFLKAQWRTVLLDSYVAGNHLAVQGIRSLFLFC